MLCGHLASGNMNPGDPGKAGRDSGSKATAESEIQRAPGTHPGSRQLNAIYQGLPFSRISKDSRYCFSVVWHRFGAAALPLGRTYQYLEEPRCLPLIVLDEVSRRAAWNRIKLPGDDGPDFESGTCAIRLTLGRHWNDVVFRALAGSYANPRSRSHWSDTGNMPVELQK